MAGDIQPLAASGHATTTDDAYVAREDTPLMVTAQDGVLANDSDPDDNAPQAFVDVGPLHGGLTLAEDGSFSYSPFEDYNGSDGFTYRLKDSQGNDVAGTVALTVTPVNDAPSFTAAMDELVVSDEMPRVFRASGDPAPSESLAEWALDRVSGPTTASDEAGENLTFSVTTDNSSLFADQPAMGNYGTLTFTTAANASGVAVVTVTLKDSGGTADGGVDTSVHTVQITVVKPHAWHNVVNPLDVTHDGHVAPVDALAVINFLNAFGSKPVPQNPPDGAPLLDVTGDNTVAPNDALSVINSINAGNGATHDIPGSATFVGADETTQGDWQTQYGRDGYVLSSERTSLPSYATTTFTGGLIDLYEGFDPALTNNDPRALQKPGSSDRTTAAWAGDYSFTLDLNLRGGQSHRVALYMVDGGRNGRSQRLDVIDATTGQVLDTRSVEDFGDGKYLVWSLSGHVKIQFTNIANGKNAVLSGAFFG